MNDIRNQMIEYAALVSANEPNWSPEEIAEDAVEEIRHRSSEDELKVGDRIKVTELMKNDPSPIPVGATGTVDSITLGLDGNIIQVKVRWDSKRSLYLIFPEDADIFVVESRLALLQAMEHYDEIVTLTKNERESS